MIIVPIMVLLWGLNEIKQVQCPASCLIHNECLIDISYYYYFYIMFFMAKMPFVA